MGRHKKVKKIDPFYKEGRQKPQKNSRLQRLERRNVNNLKPKNLDEQQQMSQKFKLFLDTMNAAKKQQPKGKKSKNKFHDASQKSHSKPEDHGAPAVEPITYKQKPSESERMFIHRINSETYQILEETEMAIKLQLGADPLEELEEGKEGGSKKKEGSQRKKERLIKMKEKKKKKQQQMVEDLLEKEKFQDHVKFGEVAMRPPELKAKPRKSADSAKPGQKSLILKTMLDDKSKEKSLQDRSKTKKSCVKGLRVTKTKKRKHMNVAEKRQFDKAQTLAIHAYRQAKKEKRKENQMNNVES